MWLCMRLYHPFYKKNHIIYIDVQIFNNHIFTAKKYYAF